MVIPSLGQVCRLVQLCSSDSKNRQQAKLLSSSRIISRTIPLLASGEIYYHFKGVGAYYLRLITAKFRFKNGAIKIARKKYSLGCLVVKALF